MAGTETVAGDIDALLRDDDRKDLLRFLTAGSVDDGKSTLIGRLLYDSRMIYEDQLAAIERDSARKGRAASAIDLSLLTDGLRAEREQGITIDVAYRYFATRRRKFIIADCPGHEQYTRNMATGASNCDLAIILVDARHGVVRQTKRHSFIVSLLGIKHVVVAVNKMDLVGYSQEAFDTIVGDYAAFAARLEIPDLRFIPLSALDGDNVVEPSSHMPWHHGETLLHYLENVHIASDRNLIDLRFPVQYVNRPHRDFRGFAGTLASGTVKTGDDIMALPSGARSRVKSVRGPDGERPDAFAPMAITVTLEDEIDVSRGDMLVHPGNMARLDQSMEAMVVWMGEDPLVPEKRYLIKHTTSLVTGHVSALRYKIDVNTLGREPATSLAMNEVGRCAVRLNRKICFDPYAKNRTTGAFIFIDRATNRTVGAGMIVDRATSLRFLEDHWPAVAEPAAEPAAAPAAGRVTPEERQARLAQRPVTVLITGLSGSGKTSIAHALERRLFDAGHLAYVLDGGRMRESINRDLQFSASERSENLRRSVQIARLLNDAGLICIAAFVAPSREVRGKARATIGSDAFLEVHVNTPVEVCRQRDAGGMYARADSGELPDFAGVSAPYEPPVAPDLTIDGATQTPEASADALMDLLKRRGVF